MCMDGYGNINKVSLQRLVVSIARNQAREGDAVDIVTPFNELRDLIRAKGKEQTRGRNPDIGRGRMTKTRRRTSAQGWGC